MGARDITDQLGAGNVDARLVDTVNENEFDLCGVRNVNSPILAIRSKHVRVIESVHIDVAADEPSSDTKSAKVSEAPGTAIIVSPVNPRRTLEASVKFPVSAPVSSDYSVDLRFNGSREIILPQFAIFQDDAMVQTVAILVVPAARPSC